MWRKLMSMMLVGVLLLSGITGQRVALSSENGLDTSSSVLAQIDVIEAQGADDDILPIIVKLQMSSYARGLVSSPLDKQRRINAVRSLQQDFAVRHATRINVVSQQPRLYPIVFGTMRRSDVRSLARDTRVVSIFEDTLSEPIMDVSTVLIGSYAANIAGVDGAGTSVAVLDTGVLTGHEFLSGQVVAEACFSNYWGNGASLCPSGSNTSLTSSNQVGSAAPCVGISSCDHGTHVAGTVAGKVIDKGDYVLRGVAPAAKIIGIQVFTNLSGSLSSWSADQLLAMEWLLEHMDTPEWGELAALNMSLGGGSNSAACDFDVRKQAIDDLRLLGVATVIASGNNGYLESISGPACISSAIAVGSSTTSSAIGNGGVVAADEIAAYSNAPAGTNNSLNGNGDRLLDLLAPGMYIWSATTTSPSTYAWKSGTSMAAPHVAGAWALLKQVASDAPVIQVLEWFRESGVPLTDTRPNTTPYALRYGSITPTPYTLLYAARSSLTLPRIQVDGAVGTAEAEVTDTPLPTATFTTSPTATVTDTPQPTATFTASPIVNTATRTLTNTPRPTLIVKPKAFNKTAPTHNMTNRPVNIVLSWAASSGATSYEYCLATTAAKCTNWKSVGTARSVTVRSLARNRAYFWNVRAKNRSGTTVANGGVWKFTTIR
jgi:subtilisin family serine protease